MANTKLSDLTASAANLTGTDIVPAVQTAGVGPVKMTGLQLAGGLLGSTALSGATVTTSQPVANWTQTWNAGAVTFTGLKFNVTDTASAAASLLMDLQVGGASKFSVSKAGTATAVGNIFAPSINAHAGSGVASNYVRLCNATTGVELSSGSVLTWYPNAPISGSADTFIRRAAAATIQLGAADVAGAPVAQTLRTQSASGVSNTAGAAFTIQGSAGTGTGAGGNIVFQVAPASTSESTKNAYATALTVGSDKTVIAGAAYTVATLPTAGTQGRRAWVTDATSPTFLGTLTGGGAVVCPVFDNGTAWVAG